MRLYIHEKLEKQSQTGKTRMITRMKSFTRQISRHHEPPPHFSETPRTPRQYGAEGSIGGPYNNWATEKR